MSAVNETLIRDVVAEVLGRLNGATAAPAPAATPASACGCSGRKTFTAAVPLRGKFGVFQDANEACTAAQEAFLQLSALGIAGRIKIVQLVKKITTDKAQEWGKLELDETKIGRLDHKIEKLTGLRAVPGVEFLHPTGFSGDHGITLEENAPFGVIGAITPSTHSIPTLACNMISMISAGNAIVFNPHPGAYKCAVTAARFLNEAIHRETGIENLACVINPPTLESFAAMSKNEWVRLICVTGGPGVVKAALASGKRAICAGPGNPPVLVDGTSPLDYAAKSIIFGAAYDNNLLCISEKEVFVLEPFFDPFMAAMEKQGAARLTAAQVERLTQAAFTFPAGQGAGCAKPSINRDVLGRDATVLARLAGATVPANTELLFAETNADHLFVEEEQMMPFLPIVRVKSVEEGIAAAKKAEHGFRHSAIIHSHDVATMTAMAKALDTTLFVKNGASVAGLGNGGEGYPNFSIATATGEGISNPRTFTRVRRCVMVGNLSIF
jgi:aldehyde dehydrogenase